MIGGIAVGVFLFRINQRPASGKAVVDPMPVADTRLSKLPAQKNDFRAEHARKVNQSLFHSFAHATMAMDFLDPSLDLLYQFRDLIVSAQLFHKIRRVGIELLVTNDRFAFHLEPPQIFKDPLDDRPQGWQQQVGFVHSKQPGEICRSFHSQTILPNRVRGTRREFRHGIAQKHYKPRPFLSSRRRAMLSE